MPAVLNAANEVAVHAFLNKRISFIEIAKVVSLTMEAHDVDLNPNLADIITADKWARRTAGELIS
jgi:1-deoxy-D-xylulose-5-phosphate reductoisomerase